MSLIETIDLRYVKEAAHFATADRPGFGDLHSGLARYLMRSGGKGGSLRRGARSTICRSELWNTSRDCPSVTGFPVGLMRKLLCLL
jgi:hypothetical protein